MLKHISNKKMGRSKLDWLESYHHFSFANYFNPANINFGVLRVLNDDIVQPGKGFETHPHKDMEIISYVIEGVLTHTDSLKNRHSLKAGQVQYMSAGTGIMHSEHNLSHNSLRFIQIWILPDKKGYNPNYGDVRFDMNDRLDKWLHIATNINNKKTTAPVHIHADINVYAAIISPGQSLIFDAKENRQAYLVLLEGKAKINDITLNTRDALEIVEENIAIQALNKAHVFIVEMAKT